MKQKKLLLLIVACLLMGCASTKMVEEHTQGGTIKFRRRGLLKGNREEKALSKADEHCKRNGFKTYRIDREVQDGRFLVVQFSCQ